MSHLFSCLLMLISCHVCSYRISQSSTSQIGMFLPSATQPGTDACTCLHFASPLSFVSHSYGFLSRGFCCACPSPLLHTVLLIPVFPIVLTSHPSYLLSTFTLLASLHLLSSISYTILNSLPPFFSLVFLFILAFSPCIPLLVCLPSFSHFAPPLSADSFVRCSVKSVLGAAIEA